MIILVNTGITTQLRRQISKNTKYVLNCKFKSVLQYIDLKCYFSHWFALSYTVGNDIEYLFVIFGAVALRCAKYH